MTTSEGARNHDQARHEAKASHYETDHKAQLKGLIDALSTFQEPCTTQPSHLATLD